jgi:hypothetical protein
MSTLKDYTNAIEQPLVGEVIPALTAPEGYFLCDGSIVSQNSYSNLYSQVGLLPTFTSLIPYPRFTTTLFNITHGNGTYVSVGASGSILTSSNGILWTVRNASTHGGDINGVTYQNGLFVYGGTKGAIATSTDAITWTARTSGTTSTITSLIYGNGVFVYAGANGAIATSTDAITWTARTSGTTSTINRLIYDNGLFVYGGNGGVLRTSTDAITWTARTSGTTSNIFALTYGNGLYIYAGNGGVLRTSTDAITWTARTSGVTTTIFSLNYGQGLYVYGTTAGIIRTSSNGITWTARTPSSLSFPQFRSIVYANGLFVIVGTIGCIKSSSNGILWLERSITTSTTVTRLAYGNGTYVYIGDTQHNIRVSTDTENWISVGTGINNTTATLDDIVYGNEIFLYRASSNYYGTSLDGITWTAYLLTVPESVRVLSYGNGLFIRGGANGTLATSSNGITWTARTSNGNTTDSIRFVEYVNGLYYYGQRGILGKSSNSITWTSNNIPDTIIPYSMTYGNGIYLIAGSGGYATSIDTVNWTSYTLEITDGDIDTKVEYNNGIFFSYVGISRDAINWYAIGNLVKPKIINNLLFSTSLSVFAKSEIYNYNIINDFKLPEINSSQIKYYIKY